MPAKLARGASIALLVALGSGFVACASETGIVPRGFSPQEMPIDLERFMGDWYVIAHIPTAPEEDAYDAVERYQLREDGDIDVRFLFCEGASDGPLRELTQLAWVYDPDTNAEWRVRPFWPLRLAYQISELDPDYAVTVVTHPSGYAWVMARRPELPEERLAGITARLEDGGFDTTLLRRVPHDDGVCRDGRTTR